MAPGSGVDASQFHKGGSARQEGKPRITEQGGPGITRCKGSSTCFEMRKMAALRGKTTGLAADGHLDSRLSLRHMAFSGSCLGFIRSCLPEALQPGRIYTRGHKSTYYRKTSLAPSTSPIKSVILLIK